MQRIGLLGISVLPGLALVVSLSATVRELPWHVQKGSKIAEFVLKPEDNWVAYAVLAFGGFLGPGGEFIAMPLSALKPGAEADTFILTEAI